MKKGKTDFNYMKVAMFNNSHNLMGVRRLGEVNYMLNSNVESYCVDSSVFSATINV